MIVFVFILTKTNSYEWFIPFTYSIETIGGNSSILNSYNISNIHPKVTWIKPENKKSSKRLIFINYLYKLIFFKV